jgi:hypothetical protein
MNNRGNNAASEYRFNENKTPSNYGTPMAGEVKVLPNQTQKKLRQWDMETNFSDSAYKQVRVSVVLKHNAVEELYGGSGCKAPHISTYALDRTWYLPSRSRRFNHQPPTKVYSINHTGETGGPTVVLGQLKKKALMCLALIHELQYHHHSIDCDHTGHRSLLGSRLQLFFGKANQNSSLDKSNRC